MGTLGRIYAYIKKIVKKLVVSKKAVTFAYDKPTIKH